MVVKKEKLLTVDLMLIELKVELANFLLRNEKFATVYNKCPKIPPPTSVHFATGVRRSHVFRLS
jgi:hypothetical protein